MDSRISCQTAGHLSRNPQKVAASTKNGCLRCSCFFTVDLIKQNMQMVVSFTDSTRSEEPSSQPSGWWLQHISGHHFSSQPDIHNTKGNDEEACWSKWSPDSYRSHCCRVQIRFELFTVFGIHRKGIISKSCWFSSLLSSCWVWTSRNGKCQGQMSCWRQLWMMRLASAFGFDSLPLH